MEHLQVYKFGGASVKDAAAILNLCRIVRDFGPQGPLVVVVSAMGKTTNALEEIYDLAHKQQSYEAPLLKLEQFHQQTATELGLTSESSIGWYFNKLLLQLRQRLAKIKATDDYDEYYDQVVSFGEMLASQLVAHALGAQSFNSQQLISTDTSWREARVDWQKTAENVRYSFTQLLLAGPVVTQGFLGGTSYGVGTTQDPAKTIYKERTTTLGREGSDYTAAILAYCLRAESVTIWKDVAGLLNADPKIFPDTVRYPEISYRETIEMAYYGASVIHPKTLKPLADRGIPLRVKSFLDPAAEGTLIHDCQHPTLAPAFIRKTDQCLLSFASKDFSFISEENLAVIFGALAQAKLKINVMQNSAISFSVCTDFSERRVHHLLDLLREQFTLHYNTGLQLFTIKNYDAASIARLTEGKRLLLEQRTRSTFQFVCQA
ncbi:aspartate kinase [Hymenobacter sp. BT523]|uniref:aspartate kinase n=1 Tax=Hymenobacter sp. BT523 TaxID=2795725 RepID=UPI0018ED1C44|nr:aspartate kinase [Hymenobacter sp. BT523]MBJ6109793.1 aspartate kinase [Hymenobacter sp. BT523]